MTEIIIQKPEVTSQSIPAKVVDNPSVHKRDMGLEQGVDSSPPHTHVNMTT
jgi:hypothetical protein